MVLQPSGRFTRFVERRLRIADQLADGVLDGTRIEAYLLASGVLSSMAAFVWPGDKKDRRRIVELWIRNANHGPSPDTISVPLLAQHLRQSGEHFQADQIEAARAECFCPGEEDRVLTGPDVDASDHEVRNVAPSLAVKTIRKFSYANIFYEEVRSSVVHEFSLGGAATDMPMAVKPAFVSYSNLLVPNETPDSRREIYFEPHALMEVIRSIARNLDIAPTQLPLGDPAKWWLDGV